MNRKWDKMKHAIAYYRVSTCKQGRSGLGLEAQQTAVKQYCKENDFAILAEIVEVRSTRKHRKGLFKALDLCTQKKATLIVAKLDRLGRDVEEIAGIVKSKVEIKVVDNPHADRFTIHILAAVAQEQRQRISDTTKEALCAAKKRGMKLGKNGKALAETNKRAAIDFAYKLDPLIRQLRCRGIKTVRQISKALNKKRVPTFRGVGKWHPSTVATLINRLKKNTIIHYPHTA
ncbi:recombinase family protein [Mucilaginibacter calamicampi]|uniref:Recombinase family protein n=1 Tax=Mucilaginibacter calamicampi TaxID=1302352 RepID=A0ABW2YZJ4_9SPHI